jgi:hypothetical protein
MFRSYRPESRGDRFVCRTARKTQAFLDLRPQI